jgi:hypothetical protein
MKCRVRGGKRSPAQSMKSNNNAGTGGNETPDEVRVLEEVGGGGGEGLSTTQTGVRRSSRKKG